MEFQVQNGCLQEGYYKGDIEKISVPASVDFIDRRVFYDLNNTKTIVIPESVMYLGEEAFSDCPNLEAVNIPASVTEIHINFFYNCPKLKIDLDEKTRFKKVECRRTITHYYFDSAAHEHDFDVCNQIVFHHSYLSGFNKGWKTVDYYQKALVEFILHPEEYPEDLRKINQRYVVKNKTEILKSLQNYDEYEKVVAFYENIDRESGVIDIKPDNDSFTANDNSEGFSSRIQAEPVAPEKAADFQIKNGVLEKYLGKDEIVTIPLGVTEIGNNAFQKNEKIRKVVIPSDVRKINDGWLCGAFSGCNALSEVIIGEGITDLGRGTFNGCGNLQSINLPRSLLSISANLFDECISLKSIKIPPKVKIIGDYAFSKCSALHHIDIPFGVEILGSGAFTNCKNLTSINIPSSVTEISGDTFSGCSKLKINFDNKTRFKVLNIQKFCYVSEKDKILLELLHRTLASGIKDYYGKTKWIISPIEFIKHTDQYPEDLKDGYRKLCGQNKKNIIEHADKSDKETVITFFSELEKTQGIPDKTEKVLLLEKMADESSFKEFKEFFEKNKPFEFYPRVLEKACISGDIDKVKLLLDAGASFTCVEKKSFENNYKTDDRQWETKEMPDPKTKKSRRYIVWTPNLQKILTSPATPPENIIEIFRLLQKNNLIDAMDVFLSSVFSGTEKITKLLFEKNIIREKNIGNRIDDAFISHEIKYHDLPYSNTNELLRISEELRTYEFELFTDSYIRGLLYHRDAAFYKPETMESIIAYYGIDLPFSLRVLFENITSTHMDLINCLINEGWLMPFSSYVNTGFFEHSFFYNNPENVYSFIMKTNWPVSTVFFSWLLSLQKGSQRTWLKSKKEEILNIGKSRVQSPETNPSEWKIKELNYSVAEIDSYLGERSNILIPARIGDNIILRMKKGAFRNKKIHSAVIEDGINMISNNAFRDCKKLESVQIPDSVVRIGDSAFKGCVKLQKITIPSGVRIIDPEAFSGCCELHEVIISEGVRAIGNNAFSNCSKLQKIDFPSSVVFIGKDAFSNCANLTSIVFHEGLQHICTNAFTGCGDLSNVTLPDSVKYIDEPVFSSSEDPNQVQEIVIPFTKPVAEIEPTKPILPMPKAYSETLQTDIEAENKSIDEDAGDIADIKNPVKPEEEKRVILVEKRKITDPNLALQIDRAFAKLEEYFPEHKVFSLDNIDKGLRAIISDLYKRAGYQSDNEMLLAYGFEFISGEAVKEIRNHVEYSPGNEPEIIRSKVESMLLRLEEAYPDRNITGNFAKDHKSLSGTVSGLYQWLGYPDAAAMLSAYGYTYTFSKGGSVQVNDYDELIRLLVEKYKTGPKPKNMSALIRENPEYKAQLKTLQNNQYKILGMKATEYFIKAGICDSNGPETTDVIPISADTGTDQDQISMKTDPVRNTEEDLPKMMQTVDQSDDRTGMNPETQTDFAEEPGDIVQTDELVGKPELSSVEGGNGKDSNATSSELSAERSDTQINGGTGSEPVDQKAAWIHYQASEVMYSGRASAYFFFALRNEMTLGNYDWQSVEFLNFYLKYFPGMNEEQLAQLRMQAIPWLNDMNTCNSQFQIVIQDSFEHRYVMIASAWLERAANYDPVSRVQFVFNACRSFFYPQEQQTVWQRLCSEIGL